MSKKLETLERIRARLRRVDYDWSVVNDIEELLEIIEMLEKEISLLEEYKYMYESVSK